MQIPSGNSNSGKSLHLSANTYVSLGLILAIVVGVWSLSNAINSVKTEVTSAKSEVETTRTELINRFDKLESRVSNLENSKTIWTGTDMLKWSVHLKDANPTLKVPEPEIRQ